MDRGDELLRPPGPRFPAYPSSQRGDSLADLLERILDKGLMIAGDISVSIVDIELLKIRVRLMITSLEKAEELGIDWWRNDPFYSSRAPRPAALSAASAAPLAAPALPSPALEELLAGMRALREEVETLRREQAAMQQSARAASAASESTAPKPSRSGQSRRKS